MAKNSSSKDFPWFKAVISAMLFLLCGLASSYLYCSFKYSGGVFLPGLLYTSTTILIFLLADIQPPLKNLLIYYSLMILTYLIVWFLTMCSSYFAFLGGIVTAGVGAIATLILTDKFVNKISFNKTAIFIWGGLAFLITDIIHFSPGISLVEYLFAIEGSIETLFTDVFIFWQLIIGVNLFILLHRAK